MTDPRITDEAIERAAIAACETAYPPKSHKPWDDLEDWEQDAWRATVRAALKAARPHLASLPVEIVVDHRPGETCSVVASTDPDSGFARLPMPTREALCRTIEQAASEVDLAKYFLPGTTDRFADAVLSLLTPEAVA